MMENILHYNLYRLNIINDIFNIDYQIRNIIAKFVIRNYISIYTQGIFNLIKNILQGFKSIINRLLIGFKQCERNITYSRFIRKILIGSINVLIINWYLI